MIRVSKVADYAIILLSHIAKADPSTQYTAREAAEQTDLPLPMASKILKSLARGELLASHRGSKGGYRLARSPKEISLAQVITSVEGPFGLTECTALPGQCSHESGCDMQGNWNRVNQLIVNALDQISLAEMMEPPAHLFELTPTQKEMM